jgi:transcriptional antiterminator NusG
MVADDQQRSDETDRLTAGDEPQADASVADSVTDQSSSPDLADESSVDSSAAPPDGPVSDDSVSDDSTTDESAGEQSAVDGETPGAKPVESGPRQVVDPASGIVLDVVEDESDEDAARMEWYILKVQVNREDSIRDALLRRIKIEGLEEYFADVIVPVEELAEYTKTGKRRIVKRKLYPGYILVHMVINDDTWFVVRETPGVGDFTGSAGKPTPMETREVERILRLGTPQEDGAAPVKTSIPFRSGDRVRVKDGNFQNFEGEVDTIDEANGRIVVIINIFNRSTPVELEHWQVEAV